MTYTITTTIDAPFDDASAAVTTALQDEGFGVLRDISVKTTLKENLDIDVNQNRILGACNPPLAHEGLAEEPELGALLPCNVIVYETDGGDVVVSAVDPQQLVGITENQQLDETAIEVHERFERVLAVITDQLTTESELQ